MRSSAAERVRDSRENVCTWIITAGPASEASLRRRQARQVARFITQIIIAGRT